MGEVISINSRKPDTVIHGHITYISKEDAEAFKRSLGVYTQKKPLSYEDDLNNKINLCNWRAESLQEEGSFDAAAEELLIAEGLKWALSRYLDWGID